MGYHINHQHLFSYTSCSLSYSSPHTFLHNKEGQPHFIVCGYHKSGILHSARLKHKWLVDNKEGYSILTWHCTGSTCFICDSVIDSIIQDYKECPDIFLCFCAARHNKYMYMDFPLYNKWIPISSAHWYAQIRSTSC